MKRCNNSDLTNKTRVLERGKIPLGEHKARVRAQVAMGKAMHSRIACRVISVAYDLELGYESVVSAEKSQCFYVRRHHCRLAVTRADHHAERENRERQ